MREVGTIGEWTYQPHRMARFESGKLFSFVSAVDDSGSSWEWAVMLPDAKSRTKGTASSAIEAVQAADAVASGLVGDAPDDAAVHSWAIEHLQWRADVESSDAEATTQWSGS